VNPAERDAFLARPLTAIISTIGKDGTPRGTPVWFLHENNRILIWTDAGRAWVRNIDRTPRGAVTVAENERPFGAVLLRGTGQVQHDRPDAPDVIRRISAKYVAPDELDAYIAQYAELTTIVEVTIESFVGWNRGY
jgi:PPOX class probable F420-dependent enzyme